MSHGIRVLFILIVVLAISEIGKIFIKKTIKALIRKSYKTKGVKDDRKQKRKQTTLINVFVSFFRALVWVMAILTILPEFGINIGPLLAGIGVAGLALGLGARSLIQDCLTGFLIIFEDHYRVGEEIEIVGIKGKVLDVNLRRTILQDQEENIHYISNSQVKKASNFSRIHKERTKREEHKGRF